MNDKQKDLIREVFMRHGFTIKDGRDDLADYVYAAAHDLLQVAPAVQVQPVEFCEDTALSIAERTFSTEVDERLASDIIQYAQRLHSLYTATQPTEQQPAPDVTGLVDALEKARDAIGSLPKDALGNVPDTQQCQGWHIRDELINDISTALAAYRNQGGDT